MKQQRPDLRPHTIHPLPLDCEDCRVEVLAACERLLKVEREIKKMDRRSRDWFFSKEGHTDAFLVARAMKAVLKQGL